MLSKWRLLWSLAVVVLLLSVFAPASAQSIPKNTFRWVVTRYLTVSEDLTVADDTVLSGDLTLDPVTDLTLTMNGWITPTGSFQPVRSAGAVSISGARIAPGTSGDLLYLYNAGSQTITISETTGLVSAGNIALGTLDSATLVYSGTTWIQIGASNN